mmetsp:Transcript_24946/g.24413  ORF Transcript_24946/g.24413 Transcript_24946/m.24413 type:complete len:87 (+) Transcript_24946:192-452(+)
MLIKKVLSKVNISYIKPSEVEESYRHIVKAIKYFRLLSSEHTIETFNTQKKQPNTYLDVFVTLLSDKLTMGPEDIDLIIMKHEFTL